MPRVSPKFPVRAFPLAAVQAEACEAAAYFQSERALPDFSISVRWLLHTALVLQWLLTSQSLIHSFVQLIIGKTGELLSFIQAVHFAIFTLSELGQFSLNSFPKTEIRAFGTSGVGGAFSSTIGVSPVHSEFVWWPWEKKTSFSQLSFPSCGAPPESLTPS